MAALFWWCVLLLELTLSLALTAAIAGSTWSLARWLLGVACILALLKCCLIATSFLLAVIRGGGVAQGARARCLLRALLTEYVWFSLAEWRMCTEPLRRMREVAPRRRELHARPVLLIHGVACNRAVWASMIPRLRSAGYGPIRSLNLEPMFADIDSHGAAVERALAELGAHTGEPVAIVAHSMGGLVALATLRSAHAGLVDRLITIATPYQGTAMPLCTCRPALRQLRLGSDWLRTLHATPLAAGIRLTCIYSLEDNLVVPAGSAALAGAHCESLRGIGHVGMLHSPRVVDRVLKALQSA